MRIAELGRQAGVPVATIKYYLREGILPPGELTSPNQARYDERHLRRLRLVRALIEVGRVPVATIREILAEIDRPEPDLHSALGCALKPTAGPGEAVDDDAYAAAQRQTEELIEQRGWRVSPDAPARRAVAEVIAALSRLDVNVVAMLDRYADAAERIAAADLDLVSHRDDAESIVYAAVVGTILGDALMAGLRRLAQESTSARTFPATPSVGSTALAGDPADGGDDQNGDEDDPAAGGAGAPPRDLPEPG